MKLLFVSSISSLEILLNLTKFDCERLILYIDTTVLQITIRPPTKL
jgi:hypothetical protein